MAPVGGARRGHISCPAVGMAEVNVPAPVALPLLSPAVSHQSPCETPVGAEAVAEALGGCHRALLHWQEQQLSSRAEIC